MIIGCEDFPKSEHGKLLIEDISNFINKNYHYSGHTVIKAFEMAATHSLFLDGKRVDPSTFGKYLSRSSVGKVLTAYKESVRDGKARPTGYDYNSKQLQQAPVKKLTPAEAHDLILKWCKEDGKLPFVAPYLHAYEYLLENNQVKAVASGSNNRFKKQEEDQRITVTKQWYQNNVCKG